MDLKICGWWWSFWRVGRAKLVLEILKVIVGWQLIVTHEITSFQGTAVQVPFGSVSPWNTAGLRLSSILQIEKALGCSQISSHSPFVHISWFLLTSMSARTWMVNPLQISMWKPTYAKYGLNSVLQKFVCWNSNPWRLRMWSYLEIE